MADWKTELKDAYDKSADEKVKESDAAYQKKIAQVLGDALSRGLGRSSYATATQANLMDDMSEAGNQIRTDFRLEYLKALQQREQEETQMELEKERLAEQKRQFDLKLALEKEAAAAASYGSGGGGYGRSSGSSSTAGTTTPFTDYNPSKAIAKNTLNAGASLVSNMVSNVNKTVDNKKKAGLINNGQSVKSQSALNRFNLAR